MVKARALVTIPQQIRVTVICWVTVSVLHERYSSTDSENNKNSDVATTVSSKQALL